MLYHLMLITGLRLSEALSLNVEHASRAKVELKVKGWSKKGERNPERSEGKKERFKTVYFPKALQGHLKEYLNFEHLVKVKTRKLVNSVNVLKGFKEIEIVSPQEL